MRYFACTVAAVLFAWWVVYLEAWGVVFPLAVLVAVNLPWVRKRLMKDGK